MVRYVERSVERRVSGEGWRVSGELVERGGGLVESAVESSGESSGELVER